MGAGRTWRAVLLKPVLMIFAEVQAEIRGFSNLHTAETGRLRESVTARCAHPGAPILSLDN